MSASRPGIRDRVLGHVLRVAERQVVGGDEASRRVPRRGPPGRPSGRTGRRSRARARGWPRSWRPAMVHGPARATTIASNRPASAPGSKAAMRSAGSRRDRTRPVRGAVGDRDRRATRRRRARTGARPIRPAPTTRISRPRSGPLVRSIRRARRRRGIADGRTATIGHDDRPAAPARRAGRPRPSRAPDARAASTDFAQLVQDLVLADHDRVATDGDGDGMAGRGRPFEDAPALGDRDRRQGRRVGGPATVA